MDKIYIIPINILDFGCPTNCMYCGRLKRKKNYLKVETLKDTIDKCLNNSENTNIKKEVFFMGGNFLELDKESQKELLSTVYEYIKNKELYGIRLLVRPDYINKESLKLLKKYKVTTIELCASSSNDYILKNQKKNYTYLDIKMASKLIKRSRIKLGFQMEIGSRESTNLDDLNTARDLAKFKPKTIRIYPGININSIEFNQDNDNIIESIVDRCKEVMYYLDSKKIPNIKIALDDNEVINVMQEEPKTDALNLDLFRQRTESSIYYDRVVSEIKKLNMNVKEIVLTVNPQEAKNVIGIDKENIKRFKDIYGVDVKVKKDFTFKIGEMNINVVKNY